MSVIHPTRHVILSLSRVEEFDDCFRFDKNIIGKNDLVISAVLHQGFKDTISESRKEFGAIIAVQVIRLRNSLIVSQYTPLYTHGIQSFIELLEECRRLVIASALEDGDEDIVRSEVINSFDDAVGPIGYNLFIVVEHNADKYLLYSPVSENVCERYIRW